MKIYKKKKKQVMKENKKGDNKILIEKMKKVSK